ncbi:MAG: MltA domain-containing protein [Magnetococcus sp. DMHC-6]
MKKSPFFRPGLFFLGMFFLALVLKYGVVPVLFPPRAGDLVPISWSRLEFFLSKPQNLTDWVGALQQSADYYRRRDPLATFSFGESVVTAEDLAFACDDLASVAKQGDGAVFYRHLTQKYRLYRSVGADGAGEVLVTGYYEPLLYGDRHPSERFYYPLYQRPEDIFTIDLSQWSTDYAKKQILARLDGKQIRPYFDRRQIDREGKLSGRGLELVWVDDPIQAFFLHVQGSGRIELPNGERIRVGYAGENGRPYRSIGKLLIEEQEVSREKMTMPVLREWLTTHPSEVNRILEYNPSYVFFKELQGGPFGNIGVTLTPGRSIATDHHLFPKGAPGILTTSLPIFAKDGKTVGSWQRETRLVVNQDTGGAIRGPGRVDLFMGFGKEAEQTAGILKQGNSRLYFIVPVVKKEKNIMPYGQKNRKRS